MKITNIRKTGNLHISSATEENVSVIPYRNYARLIYKHNGGGNSLNGHLLQKAADTAKREAKWLLSIESWGLSANDGKRLEKRIYTAIVNEIMKCCAVYGG